jgi:hypothetical protein
MRTKLTSLLALLGLTLTLLLVFMFARPAKASTFRASTFDTFTFNHNHQFTAGTFNNFQFGGFTSTNFGSQFEV